MRGQFLAYTKDGELKFHYKREIEQFFSDYPNEELVVDIRSATKQRTFSQNSALHLWFDLLANELNEAGYTVQLVLKEKVDLDWDGSKVKELLWRPAQKAILGKNSTTELSKIEDIDKVFDHLNRHISERFGLSVQFPSQEQMQNL